MIFSCAVNELVLIRALSAGVAQVKIITGAVVSMIHVIQIFLPVLYEFPKMFKAYQVYLYRHDDCGIFFVVTVKFHWPVS